MSSHHPSWKKAIVITTAINIVGISASFANPVLDNVASGDASVEQTATTTTVHQNSQQAIINWDSFNIAASEKTQFVQPNSDAIALNRINPNQGASQIFGQLTANGQIILVNAAGIYFGPNSKVDVGSMIASTANISNENFLAGNYVFDQPSPYAAAVVNAGNISAADYGLVALLGTSVSNEGTIKANLGTVALASGDKFIVDFYGDGYFSFAFVDVDQEASRAGVDHNGKTLKDGVKNSGTILANGGTIIMTAEAAENVLDNAINMTGVAQAQSVSESGGEIILSSETGNVKVSGKIDASGKEQDQLGGDIEISGKQISVESTAVIDASSDAGWGSIGLYTGEFDDLASITTTPTVTIAKGSLLDASALTLGDGGYIMVGGNGIKAEGTMTAHAGSEGGDGGMIGFMSMNGDIDISNVKLDLSAPNGEAGYLMTMLVNQEA